MPVEQENLKFQTITLFPLTVRNISSNGLGKFVMHFHSYSTNIRTPRDIIILHMFIINDNHMVYVSWDMECEGQNFCHFGPYLSLLPLTTWKIKILKKWKKASGDIIGLHKCTINDNHFATLILKRPKSKWA